MATSEMEKYTLANGTVVRRWPVASPRATVLLVHGLGEHSGRYQHVAAALGQHDIAMWAPDHPGHGESPGKRCHIDRFDQFFTALDELCDEIDAAHPGVPAFIVGHSMGGLITAMYLLSKQSRFAGAAFSGAAFEVPEPPGAVALFINRLIAAVIPTLGVLQLDPSEVSRDAEVVRRYREDPLVHDGKVSARLAVELFGAMETLRERRRELCLPILVMHGEADVMTPAAGSRQFFEAVGSEEKTLRLYPGLYHEIFNEPEQAQVLGELCDWLDARIAAA
ncbi:MAG: alpha/beta hydrolase [Halieaceae bacterium]|nr:alpha/beta hydrolase [Halieaceae bacterium]